MMRLVFSTLPVDTPPGSDFRAKHKKSKNVSSACGNPWRVEDGGQKKSPNLSQKRVACGQAGNYSDGWIAR